MEETKVESKLLQLKVPTSYFPHRHYKTLPGLNVEYRQIMSKVQADLLFEILEKELEYLQGNFSKIRILGRSIPIPRKHVAYGDAGLFYTFSGVTLPTKPWTETLLKVKDHVKLVTGYDYNYVLINRYKDGNDSIGFHADDEREIDPTIPIAALSLWQERPDH
jgi:alpha-ketoglutarate-dependent dioxygenase alkB family protein 2